MKQAIIANDVSNTISTIELSSVNNQGDVVGYTWPYQVSAAANGDVMVAGLWTDGTRQLAFAILSPASNPQHPAYHYLFGGGNSIGFGGAISPKNARIVLAGAYGGGSVEVGTQTLPARDTASGFLVQLDPQ